jgi:hypothetical protein
MPAEDQTRAQRDDHYRDVVALAGVIRTAVKDNRNCEHQKAYT